MMTVLAATILAPALPAMTKAFDDVPNAEFLVRLTLTLPALFIVIGAPFTGILLDKWGRKPVLLIGLTVFGLAGTAGFALNSLTTILVSRAILGLAVAGVMSGFTTLITDYFSGPRLNQFLGYQGAFIGLGGVISFIVAGFLVDVGWRYPFLIHLFAFFILLGVLFAVDEPEIQDEMSQPGTADDKRSFPWKSVAPIYAIAAIVMMLFFAVPTQMPFYLAPLEGIDGGRVGLALALPTLSSILFALQYQRFKARLSFQAIVSLIFLSLGVGYLIIGSSANYLIISAGLLITGIGVGLYAPNLNVWLVSIVQADVRGRAIGGLTMSIFLGQFLSPLAAEPIVQQTGLSGMFAVAGAAALLLAALFLAVALKRNPEPDTQAQSAN
jgi:MFS family permease